MEPNEISKKYKEQSKKLSELKEKLNNNEYSSDDYKELLNIILPPYIELLNNLSVEQPKQPFFISFFQKELHPKNKNIEEHSSKYAEPPFEKDFFNNHDI